MSNGHTASSSDPANMFPSHRERIEIIRPDAILTLSHRFILPDHITIHRDSVLLRPGIDFSLMPEAGEIRLHHIPDSGTVFIAEYRFLPWRLQYMYRRWSAADTTAGALPDSSPVRIRKPVQQPGEFSGQDLQKSGSIFRGISIGTNQGMRLQSGLRLQVSGQIAPNVDVVASLTDQNTPIQPEGNTQTLQEIDKVFIQVNAPHVNVTMGDFMLNIEKSRFGTYSRKLQGAKAAVSGSLGSLTVSAAASKGEFTSNHFQGTEGNQGPYQLTGAKGQREIIVLAGTERVWIDGEPMVRGEDNDYIIEYSNGQITFTRNRMITADSRITVDFEYSDQKFQKSIYGAAGELHLLNERVRIQSVFLREADDKDNPLDIPLTDDYRLVLEKSGDNPDSAAVPGARYMGSNKGYYVKTDSLGTTVYRYVGREQGDYNVQFSYVGTGQGDYSFQGFNMYQYEGPGRGDYLPVTFLPLAVSHQMAALASNVFLGRGLHLDGEFAVSSRDGNLYSPRDDGDNMDAAVQARLGMNDRPLRVLGHSMGKMAMDITYRDVGSRFRPAGRATAVEYGRRWGLEEGVSWGEQAGEFQGTYHPVDDWLIQGEWGTLNRFGGIHSRRRMLRTLLARPGLPHVQYQSEQIGTDMAYGSSQWLRQQGTLTTNLLGFQPSLRYEGEHRKVDTADSLSEGFRFDDWTGRLTYQRGRFHLELEEGMRDNRIYETGILQKNSLARTDRIKAGWRTSSGFTSSVMYTHRLRDYQDPLLEDQRTDLADMTLQFTPARRFFYSSLNYRFSSTRISQMVRDTIQVGKGLGNYRYDETLKELVPDPDGDLLLRSIQTGTFLPVNSLKTGLEIRLDGSRLMQKKRGRALFVHRLSGRTLIRVERRDKTRQFLSVNRSAFNPQWGVDTTTVMGLISWLQDIEYTTPKSGLSLRLRLRADDSENNEYARESILQRRREQGIRIKAAPLPRTSVLAEFRNESEVKTYTTGNQNNRDITLQSWEIEMSYRPKPRIEVALKTRIRNGRDTSPVPVTEAASLFFMPRIQYAFFGKGNLRAELELGQIRSEPENRSLPYEMLNGDQPGRTLRWTMLFTYQITGHIMTSLTYRGRLEPWRERLYQTGQMEVRAFF